MRLRILAIAAIALLASDAFAWTGRREVPPQQPPEPPLGVPPFSGPTPEMALVVKTMRLGFRSVTADIRRHLNSIPSSNGACDSEYQPLFAKGAVDVRLNIGYMDFSIDGGPVSFDTWVPQIGRSVTIGPNSPVSPFMYEQVIDLLTGPCVPNGSAICGFQRIGPEGVFAKAVPGPNGQPTIFRVTVTQAAASIFHDMNDVGGSLSYLQSQYTERADDNFFGGLRTADIVAYVGHARNGGGPDNRVVVRKPDLHADYAGHYKNPAAADRGGGFEGARRMREALSSRRQSGTESPYLLAIMACRSSQLFASGIHAEAPGARLAMTGDITYGPSLLTGALAAIDSSMRRQCRDNFLRAIELPQGTATVPNYGRTSKAVGDSFQLIEPRAASAGAGAPPIARRR